MFNTSFLKNVFSALMLVTLGVSAAIGQTVWYVDDSSGGLNDGSDWNNAFTELQSALAVAYDGDEIRCCPGYLHSGLRCGFRCS